MGVFDQIIGEFQEQINRPMSVVGLLRRMTQDITPQSGPMKTLTEMGEEQYSGKPISALADAMSYGPLAVSPSFRKQADVASSLFGIVKFPSGYWVKPGGEIIELEEMARHWNRGSGKSLRQMIDEGHIRGRGANLEFGDISSVDERALARALEEATSHGKEIAIDTRIGSQIYDSEDIVNAGFNLKKVKPKQSWLKGDF